MNLDKQILNIFHDAIYGNGLLFESIAAHHLESTIFEVATTHNQSYRHTLEFIVGELETRTFVVAVVIFNAYALVSESVDDRLELVGDGLQLLVSLADRNDDHLNRSESWW